MNNLNDDFLKNTYEIDCTIGNTSFSVYLDASFFLPANFLSSLPQKMHTHCCHEILIPIEGEISFKTGTDEYVIKAGSLVFCPQSVMHVSSFVKCRQYVAINFDFKKNHTKSCADTFLLFSKICSEKLFVAAASNEIIDIIKETKDNLIHHTLFSHYILQADLQKFFLLLCNNLSKNFKSDLGKPPHNIQFILSQKLNTLKPDDQLKTLAGELFISERQLIRLIKKYYNMTFIQRKNYLRAENAKTMLVSTDLSIDKIAEALNFSDRNAFTVSFKKHTGFSPAQYRKKYKKAPPI